MSKETAAPAPAEVSRVICASVSRVTGSVMHELFDVRNRACGDDAPAGFRGALLHCSGWFVFWLEGDEAAVEAILQRAARDPRNAHQKIIHRSRGPATLDETLAVSATQGGDGPGAFARRVYRIKEQGERGLKREPAAIWQELSAPCTFANDPAGLQRPHQHVVLVAAEDNGPVDLLRRLGERFGNAVVYQRFASSKRHSSDVGAAYVDIPVARQVRRIQLLSRRALGQHMVRLSATSVDRLVMMLGARRSAAIELASSVASFVGALPRRPEICLLNAGEELRGTVDDVLREGGAVPPALIALQESNLADLLTTGQDAASASRATR